MNIRIEGTKEELERAVAALNKIINQEAIISRLYPNRGTDLYRIYISKVELDEKS